MAYTHRRANRQYVAMTDSEVWQFLDSREKIFVAFPMKDGFPHVSPVWFCVLDKKIYVRTHDYKVKTKLAKAGKSCCTADDGRTYRELRGVIIWGRCRLVTEHELIERVEKILNMRYEAQQWKASEMPKSWVEERKVENRAYVEIIPERISSWDNSKIR
jgi:nitroimidazol reductase NimA-like FMN-containing flavoprotein (pyridoxamine 5'-phosphate oxidase superfamily)